MSIIVGFAGKIGSGKTALSRQVATMLDWPHASFGDYARHVATKRDLGTSRRQLQELGLSLIASGWQAFCAAVLSHGGWSPGQSLVVDGIRHTEAIDVLARATAARRFLLVYVEVSDNTRATRLANRDRTGRDALKTADKHPTESQAHSSLMRISDLVVDGSRPVGELCDQITAWVLDVADAR